MVNSVVFFVFFFFFFFFCHCAVCFVSNSILAIQLSLVHLIKPILSLLLIKFINLMNEWVWLSGCGYKHTNLIWLPTRLLIISFT